MSSQSRKLAKRIELKKSHDGGEATAKHSCSSCRSTENRQAAIRSLVAQGRLEPMLLTCDQCGASWVSEFKADADGNALVVWSVAPIGQSAAAAQVLN